MAKKSNSDVLIVYPIVRQYDSKKNKIVEKPGKDTRPATKKDKQRTNGKR